MKDKLELTIAEVIDMPLSYVRNNQMSSHHSMSMDNCIDAMITFSNAQQRAALTKFKADCIYCNGSGIKDMDIENYLNVVVR